MDFLQACSDLVSSAGEFAWLLVLAAQGFLLAAVHSLKGRVMESRSKPPFGSASARRSRGARLLSSSVLPTASAGMSPNLPSSEEGNGLSQAPVEQTPLERFLQSLPPEQLLAGPTPVDRGRSANDPHSVGRPAGDPAGVPDQRGADGGSAAAPSGHLLTNSR